MKMKGWVLASVCVARASIGLATLRKDGFASLDAGTAVGVVTTQVDPTLFRNGLACPPPFP